jgi:hypothetical protein
MVCFEHLNPNIVVVVIIVGGIGAQRKYVWNGASIEKSSRTLIIRKLSFIWEASCLFLHLHV